MEQMTLEAAQKILPGANYVREWGNYVLASRREFGSAAHRNRARYTGTKVHKLRCEYVVAVIDPEKETSTKTVGYKFMRTAQPQLFSVGPICGCTSGQHAGSPIQGLTEASVTCSKCA